MNKLRWGFSVKEEVTKLRSYINIHIGTINILLAEYGLEKFNLTTEKAAIEQLDIRERLRVTHDIVKECSGSLTAQTAVVQNTQGMLARLCEMINGEFCASWKALENMVAKVYVSTQQIYTVLIEIKASLAGPDTRWTFFQAPLVVEDAFGHKFPVPSEYDFYLLDAVIKHKFRDGPGSTEVQIGNYEYFKTKDSNSVVCSASRLFPGMAITMAVIVSCFISVDDICPILSCGSRDTTEVLGGGRTCSECNVWFTTTDRKPKSLNNLLVASSMVSDASATEDQSRNSTNPRKRKRAVSLSAEEDEPVFKNIRLPPAEDTAVSHVSSLDSSAASDLDESPSTPIEPSSFGYNHRRPLDQVISKIYNYHRALVGLPSPMTKLSVAHISGY